MESLKELYKIGRGPSSSHTMGPERAAYKFNKIYPHARKFRVTLYGSLAATGKGHLTDSILTQTLGDVEIVWKPDEFLPGHPNAIDFDAFDDKSEFLGTWRVYSIGGGSITDDSGITDASTASYFLSSMDEILQWTEKEGTTIWEYVEQCEGKEIWEHLTLVWDTMKESIKRGLDNEGVLPGTLKVPRKAWSYCIKAKNSGFILGDIGMLFAYALAVSEENASGGTVVTSPTCGSSGVLPAVLLFIQKTYEFSDLKIYKALATAGVIGLLVKTNGSISGAEVGCQGEIGTACAMAAAAAVQLLGGSPSQIEYAAEMGLEHHLGLTCDPIGGYVQIPCIERNAMAAARALESAAYALYSDGSHRVSFDSVIETMEQTGRDLQSKYRETSLGGLAFDYQPDKK